MGTSRRLVVFAIVVGLTASLPLAAAASASDRAGARQERGTTTSSTPASVAIGGGLAFSGATITGPSRDVRRLNAYQSAVWVQSWIGQLYYGKPSHERPPANLPVYRVDVTGNWGGSIETRATFYASDGRLVWVAFPRLPPSRGHPVITGWFAALPRVREAFAGTAKLELTGGTQTLPPTTAAPTTTVPLNSTRRGTRSLTLLWIAIILLAVVALSFFVSRIRARTEPDATNRDGRRARR